MIVVGVVGFAVYVGVARDGSGSHSVLEAPQAQINVLPRQDAVPSDAPLSLPTAANPSLIEVTPPPPPLPSTGEPRPKPRTTTAPAVTLPPFSALAGFRCPETASSGYTDHPASNGWYLVTGGGWTGNGCRGHMIAMPMSGDPDTDNPRDLMLWWFRLPAHPRCATEVYIPRTRNVRDAAGDPATYFVYATADGSGSPIGQFRIDQVDNQGRWVPVGDFPATSGQLSIRLMNRGTSNIAGARLGGSAVRVNC